MKLSSGMNLFILAILVLLTVVFSAPSTDLLLGLDSNTLGNRTIANDSPPDHDLCKWGVITSGRQGFGCYCASGCMDPTFVCDLPLGKCHSGAMKYGVTALSALTIAAAIAVGMP